MSSSEHKQLQDSWCRLLALVVELDAVTTEMQSSEPGTTPEQGLQRYNGSLREIQRDIVHAQDIAARMTTTLAYMRTLGGGIIEPKEQQTLTNIEAAAARITRGGPNSF